MVGRQCHLEQLERPLAISQRFLQPAGPAQQGREIVSDDGDPGTVLRRLRLGDG
jgi:hypothetical protein